MRLDRDGKYQRPRVVDETTTLSNYPGTVRQLVVTGLGRDAATVIITNARTTTVKQLIERYARRMSIEQRLAESIRCFHTDALAGSVPLNVDLDVVGLSPCDGHAIMRLVPLGGGGGLRSVRG
ncbi:hypothetical protein ACVBEQ_24805 [Nakamurella sp. GG22]